MQVLLAHAGGYDGPPPLTAARVLTSWAPSPWLVAGLVATAGLYVWGARRLRARGDHWSVWRDISFLGGGVATIALATLSFLGVYDDTLFWTHMLQHMGLSMVSPIFLALGAPVTLALRTLPPSWRRLLVRVLHARLARVLVNPVTGFALLFGTPFALYFTHLYTDTLRNPVLHDLLHVHFVVAGCVYFWPLIGVDPVPGRLPYPFRLLVLFVTVPAHAFLGITIMGGTTVIGGDYYRALGRSWGPTLLGDQNIGGGLLWAFGDVVTVVVLAALFVQWVRADEREAVRLDRRQDRAERLSAGVVGAEGGTPGAAAARTDEDDALAAYNARLAALARHDRSAR